MSAKLKTTICSQAGLLDDSHGRSHCRGELGRHACAERSACALHLRQLKEPIPTAMRLPRVEGRECHYRKGVQR